MLDAPKELLEKLPNGLPRVSRYAEFLRITGMKDDSESFVIWAQAAVTLMRPPAGRA
jgi:hypothetical protein